MKAINIENRKDAIVYDPKKAAGDGGGRKRVYSVAPEMMRSRAASVDSVYTVETDFEVDPEVVANVRPASPSIPLPKII